MRRRKGMGMLKRGVSQAEVARALEISRQTASRWASMLAENPEAWRRRQIGRPSGLNDAQKGRLKKALEKGTHANGFTERGWKLTLIAALIERKFGVSYTNTNVKRIMVEMGHRYFYRLGWSNSMRLNKARRKKGTVGRSGAAENRC